MSLNLITDRTPADYEAWLALSRTAWDDMTAAQKAVWTVPMKGAYNYTDLNRVGAAMLTLQAIFTSYGYSVAVNARTDWATGEWPSEAAMDAYVQSLKNLRGVFAAASSTPAAPDSMDDGTVMIWNNIEQILLDVEDALGRLSQSLWYSGEIGCGEV